MGLDNIPHHYPCQRAGTAITTSDNRIDCAETQAAGGCPWKVAVEQRDRGTPVLGMFGTDCWYRGKVATWMLETLAQAGHPLPPELASGFYGPDQDRLEPEYCDELAEWMEDHAEAFAAAARTDPDYQDHVTEAIEQYRYAAWWLRFVAKQADGATAWW